MVLISRRIVSGAVEYSIASRVSIYDHSSCKSCVGFIVFWVLFCFLPAASNAADVPGVEQAPIQSREYCTWADDSPYYSCPLPSSLNALSQAVWQEDAQRAALELEKADSNHISSPGGMFLRAETYRLNERYEDAIREYEEILLVSPFLSDRVRLHLAESLFEVGRYGDSAAVLDDFERDSRYLAGAVLLRGLALISSGDIVRAKEFISSNAPIEATGVYSAELYTLLGVANRLSGDLVAASQSFYLALISSPATDFGRDAAGSLIDLYEQVHNLGSLVEGDVVEELVAHFGPGVRTALARVEPLLGRSNTRSRLNSLRLDGVLEPAAPIILVARARAEAGVGRHSSAMRLFVQAADVVSKKDGASEHERKNSFEQEIAAQALFGAGRSALALRSASEALGHFGHLIERYPEHPLSTPARFSAARIALRQKDYELVSSLLQDLLLHDPLAEDRPGALFLLGWSLFRQERYGEAAGFLASSVIEEPERGAFEYTYGASLISSGARAFYWLGRAHEAAGNSEAAQEIWREILWRYPLSYYAGLAEEMLDEENAFDIWIEKNKEVKPPASIDSRVVRARQALDLGWDAELRRELASFFSMPALVRGYDLVAAAQLMREAGSIASARALYRSAAIHGSADLTMPLIQESWSFAFPIRYSEIIEREAERQGYPSWLLYGLVLRESGFAPCAQSHVGARGLAQLMMPTARDAARDLSLPAPTSQRLCEPEYNLRLGAWHLRKILRYYKDSKILAVSAYNAGQGSVNRWLTRAPDAPMDIFVEDIPFEETRAYVRMVLSAFRAYSFLSELSERSASASADWLLTPRACTL